jgi:hypothetical protein
MKSFYLAKVVGTFAGLLTQKALKEIKNIIQSEMDVEGEMSNSQAFLFTYSEDFENIWKAILGKIEFLMSKHELMFSFFHFCSFFDPMNYLHFSSPPINEVINQNSQI